jgi:phosphoesterase RecJ-like protein
VTDTGSFQFENTTVQTHLIAADLLKFGTDLGSIRSHLWESTPLESIRLITETLKTLKLDESGRIAWVTMPYTIFQRFGATTEHLEGIVNYAKAVRGVEIAIVFKEFEPHRIKVGLRSKRLVDVNKVAQALGGGGHKRASGCMIEGSLEEAQRIVIQEAKKHLNSTSVYGG